VARAATTAAPATSRRPRLAGDAVTNRFSVTREPRVYTSGALSSVARGALSSPTTARLTNPVQGVSATPRQSRRTYVLAPRDWWLQGFFERLPPLTEVPRALCRRDANQLSFTAQNRRAKTRMGSLVFCVSRAR
jgi:hypothetical protein